MRIYEGKRATTFGAVVTVLVERRPAATSRESLWPSELRTRFEAYAAPLFSEALRVDVEHFPQPVGDHVWGCL